MSKVFVSWSGGKESGLACYKAKANGLAPSYLLNMTGEDGSRSRTHGLARGVLSLQAEAIGIPLIQRKTSWESYEDNFKKVVLELKEGGIEGGVFGDIDLEPHRTWVKRVCKETSIRAYLPLWGKAQKKILEDFINLGFQAIVVAINSGVLDERWVGCKIDDEFVKDITRIESITPCGEAGEYHTLVTDGPLFKKRMIILETRIVQRAQHLLLDISRCILEDKE
ncbi:MAG: diphthine--ammonia ligase [bacterium]